MIYNTQAEFYRLAKSGTTSDHETTPYATLRVYLEPAGVTPVAPIDASVGNPYNCHVKSPNRLELDQGYKIVDTKTDDEFIVISSINEYHSPLGYSYEFVVYRKDES